MKCWSRYFSYQVIFCIFSFAFQKNEYVVHDMICYSTQLNYLSDSWYSHNFENKAQEYFEKSKFHKIIITFESEEWN